MKIFYQNLSKIKFDPYLIDKYNIFLTKSEKERLSSIKIPDLKRNFIFGRLILRQKLSEYLNCSHKDILFKKTKFGRLELSGKFSGENISFNLSHSKNIIAVIICNNIVGIDVEYIRNRDFSKIVNFSFTKKEAEYLNYLQKNHSKQQYMEAFYIYWTLKEAFVKSNGGSILQKDLNLDFSLLKNLQYCNHLQNFNNNLKSYKRILCLNEIKKDLQFETFYLDQNYIISYAVHCPLDKFTPNPIFKL